MVQSPYGIRWETAVVDEVGTLLFQTWFWTPQGHNDTSEDGSINAFRSPFS